MDDLISRQDAIDALVDKGQASTRYKVGEFWELNGQEIREALNAVPSAKRKGEWIRNVDSLYGAIQKPYCSACGKSAIGNHGFDCVLTNYCPNCGADMREEERR